MAEKHKSKYKEAKDMAKSQKIEARKDLKDYTGDEAHGMVPELVKGPQKLVPRNINGEVIDDIENMVPKIKERLYKKVEEGDYSPEHARKVFEKLQIEDTEGYLEAMEKGVYDIKESVKKLDDNQKEQILRQYVRNKIAIVLRENYVMEQDDAEAAPETPPADADPAADPGADPAADAEAPADADPGADTDTDPGADTDTDPGTDLGGGAPIGGGGGGSSPSPSPLPAPDIETDDSGEEDSEPVPIDATETNLDNTSKKFETDFNKYFKNATPEEAGSKMAQTLLNLLKGKSTAKNKEFLSAFLGAARNGGTNLKSITPSMSDDYTENT